MKIGWRPLNGGCVISSHRPEPLSKPRGLISITDLPGKISTELQPHFSQIAETLRTTSPPSCGASR
jgi:hypothetical protein